MSRAGLCELTAFVAIAHQSSFSAARARKRGFYEQFANPAESFVRGGVCHEPAGRRRYGGDPVHAIDEMALAVGIDPLALARATALRMTTWPAESTA